MTVFQQKSESGPLIIFLTLWATTDVVYLFFFRLNIFSFLESPIAVSAGFLINLVGSGWFPWVLGKVIILIFLYQFSWSITREGSIVKEIVLLGLVANLLVDLSFENSVPIESVAYSYIYLGVLATASSILILYVAVVAYSKESKRQTRLYLMNALVAIVIGFIFSSVQKFRLIFDLLVLLTLILTITPVPKWLRSFVPNDDYLLNFESLIISVPGLLASGYRGFVAVFLVATGFSLSAQTVLMNRRWMMLTFYPAIINRNPLVSIIYGYLSRYTLIIGGVLGLLFWLYQLARLPGVLSNTEPNMSEEHWPEMPPRFPGGFIPLLIMASMPILTVPVLKAIIHFRSLSSLIIWIFGLFQLLLIFAVIGFVLIRLLQPKRSFNEIAGIRYMMIAVCCQIVLLLVLSAPFWFFPGENSQIDVQFLQIFLILGVVILYPKFTNAQRILGTPLPVILFAGTALVSNIALIVYLNPFDIANFLSSIVFLYFLSRAFVYIT